MKRSTARTATVPSPTLPDEPSVFLQQEIGLEGTAPRTLRVVIDSGWIDAIQGDLELGECPGTKGEIMLALKLRAVGYDEEQRVCIAMTAKDANDVLDAFVAIARRAREIGILPTRAT